MARFVASVRLLLERDVGLVWVAGEISNFTRATSGHCYFNLKDAGAQVRCVFFRHKAQHVGFALKDGVAVEVRATASLYEARGEFQLNVETARLAGVGALYERFARLKARLDAAGWFDAARKRPLPPHPRAVGVVTSLRAAALRDVLTTLRRRWPALPVIVYPTAVQGDGAAAEIAQAIRTANARAEVDVLIVGARRRLDRGPVGVQRGGRRAGGLRVGASGRLGRRPRDRLHHLRLRRRRARGDADRGGRAGDPRPRGARARRRRAGPAAGARPARGQSSCRCSGSTASRAA